MEEFVHLALSAVSGHLHDIDDELLLLVEALVHGSGRHTRRYIDALIVEELGLRGEGLGLCH
jgi:hypothetical protein